jgi:hypothetical protein
VKTDYRPKGKQPKPTTRLPNNVYTDKDGNVYRRNNTGKWDKRENGKWTKPAPANPGTQPTTPGTRPSRSGTRPAPGTPETKPSTGRPQHPSCATTETWTAKHSAGAVAEPTATEADADAAFYETDETNTGNEAGAAFEFVHSARAEQSVNAANATVHASGDATEHADDSARASARTRSRCECAKAGTQFTNRTAKQFASITAASIES